jgi:hypothetical protein
MNKNLGKGKGKGKDKGKGKGKGKAIPVNRLWRPIGLREVKAPTFSRQSANMGEVVSLTCRLPFTRQEDSLYSFLLEAEWTPGP